MKKLVIGIFAHVDAGKTTLAEGMLYLTGAIKKLGRVDHKDAFLDTFALERARGITIFSKQAVLACDDMEITLLDTPGHVDFSAEMERTLQVLDYAVLVVSGTDGVQGHTQTLWNMLKRYQIPVFLFINKMDVEGTDRIQRLDELKKQLDDACIDFGDEQDSLMENLAVCDEKLLDAYMENGVIGQKDIQNLIVKRAVFPCYFGSALRLEGVEEFLEGLKAYAKVPVYGGEFGAKVFKIAREEGVRLTYMKITGGSLKVKTLLSDSKGTPFADADIQSAEGWEEKADQIRIYSGSRFEAVQEAEAGTICAVTGLSKTFAGENLGAENSQMELILEPVLMYRVILPDGCNAHDMMRKLRQLEEEDPQLRITWDEQLQELHIHVMGEVQIEIVKSLIQERFGVSVEFGEGSIIYKETITGAAEGVGHFEPLRHYAEVHLLLEPAKRGSGLQFAADCSEDILSRNWQRLVLTHLEEKEHLGVLTGSAITDIKITLLTGRAHQKHTEGGDFRQATYRAVRHGLKQAKSVLLEPFYRFRLEVPTEYVGRAMTDIDNMCGKVSAPHIEGELSVLTGKAPVSTMRGYVTEVTAYTKGKGRLVCTLAGYDICHNAEEVIDAIGYDSEADIQNPTGSVFCAHGAGYIVNWDEVYDFMHIERAAVIDEDGKVASKRIQTASSDIYGESISNVLKESKGAPAKKESSSDFWKDEKELEAIFERTYGPIKHKTAGSSRIVSYEKNSGDVKYQKKKTKETPRENYLLVDGYNIIFAWNELKELSEVSLDAARTKLMDILCNYQGFTKCHLILVFDAYKVKGNPGEVSMYHNIHVVYTKEAETADMYIEKVTHELGRKHHVTVATSDGLEQVIIMGQGAIRMSAEGLKEEIERVSEQIRAEYLGE